MAEADQGRHAPARHDALTGLRFIAAAIVVWYHFGAATTWHGPRAIAPALELIRATGFVAVSFFFVLSGFVLAYAYTDGGRMVDSPRRYLVNRVARIYPNHILTTVLVAAMAAHIFESMVQPWDTTVLALLGLHAWSMGTVFAVNFPSWSIGDEIFFYALFPLIVLALGRVRSVRGLVGVGVAVWLVSTVALWILGAEHAAIFAKFDRPLSELGDYRARFGDAVHRTALFPHLSNGVSGAIVKYMPPTRLPEFVCGVVLGLAYLRAGSPRVSRARVTIAGVVGAILAMTLLAPRVPGLVLHNALLVPAFAAIVWGVVTEESWVRRVLSWRPLVVLGEASYALYLLSLPVFMALQYLPLSVWPEADTWSLLWFGVYLAVLCVVSLAVHHGFERPIARAIRARWGRPTPVP